VVRLRLHLPCALGAVGAGSARHEMPPAAAQPMSDDLAALLNSKIREFEQSHAQESEKAQKLQKGKARATAKTKTKEAKNILNSSEISGPEKVKSLWSRLQAEHQQATGFIDQAQSRLQEIGNSEKEKDDAQAELNRTTAVKNKLESLCRQLQTQTNALVEERRRLTEAERSRRQELADEFQLTIGDVKRKMDQQANERNRLQRENEELRSRFKQFFEQYDRRDQELLEAQKAREVEVQAFERKLAEQAQLYRQEATRENTAQRDNDELSSTEQVLRGQLKTYSEKFSHFQDALSKSEKVLGQYKRQRNKMQRRVEVLEKENKDLSSRNDKKVVQVAKEKAAVEKEKEGLQERCKRLQSERQELNKVLEEVQAPLAA